MRSVAALTALVVVLASEARAQISPYEDPDLIAWWDFDTGFGTDDSSSKHRDLTFRPNPNALAAALPTVVPGGVGGGRALQLPPATNQPGCTDFDGSISGGDASLSDADGAVDDPTDLVDTNYTIQAWVSFASLPSNTIQTIVGKSSDSGVTNDPGWEVVLGVQPWGEKYIGIETYNGQSALWATTLTSGAWHHLVITAIGSEVYLYLDGVLQEPAVSHVSNGMGPTDFDLRIGSGGWTYCGTMWTHPMRGSVDKVALFRRALSAAEILELYNGGQGISLDDGTCAIECPVLGAGGQVVWGAMLMPGIGLRGFRCWAAATGAVPVCDVDANGVLVDHPPVCE